MSREPEPIEGCITLREATHYLGYKNVSTTWRRIEAGQLNAKLVKQCFYVTIAELDRFINERSNTSTVGLIEAARIVGVAHTTVVRRATQGKIPATKNEQGFWVFKRSDLKPMSAKKSKRGKV